MKKILTITITTTDEDGDFSTELNLIGKQVAEGFLSGHDRNSDSQYAYQITESNESK